MPSQSEPASPRKLRRARDLGDTPHSPQLAQGLVLCAVFCVAPVWLRAFVSHVGEFLRWTLGNQNAELPIIRAKVTFALELLVNFCVPILALAMITQIAVRVLESRLTGSSASVGSRSKRRIEWRARRLVTADAAWMSLASWVIVIGLVGGACVWFRHHAALLVGALGSPWTGTHLLGLTLTKLFGFACVLWTAVGAGGLALAYWLWQRRNRMSRDEKRLEQREAYGDPTVVLARQHLQRQLLTGKTKMGLKDATILVINPSREAAILHYELEAEGAPRLIGIARANGLRVLLAEAQHYEIPVVEAPALATALALGTVGEFIQESLYTAVAEVLSSVPLEKRKAN